MESGYLRLDLYLAVQKRPQRPHSFFPHENEAVVVTTLQFQKLFRSRHRLVQRLAVLVRHDVILGAVGDEHRASGRLQIFARVVIEAGQRVGRKSPAPSAEG